LFESMKAPEHRQHLGLGAIELIQILISFLI
jgi:hypothetical protein